MTLQWFGFILLLTCALKITAKTNSSLGAPVKTHEKLIFFQRDENCKLQYSLGVKLYNLKQAECLDQCLQAKSCKSFGFKAGDDDANEKSICQLNTEHKSEAETFYQCQNKRSLNWIHFEKVGVGKKALQKKSFKKRWQDGKHDIKDLQTLKTNLLKSGKDICQHEVDNLSTRNCIGLATPEYVKHAKKDLKKLLNPKTLTDETIDQASTRYGKLIDQSRYDSWKRTGRKPAGLDRTNELQMMEAYSIYRYTQIPEINQMSNGLLYGVKQLKKNTKDMSEEKINEVLNQAILMQSYLKKNTMTHPPGGTTVYRFEPEEYYDKYKKGRKFRDKTMMSTTKNDDVEAIFPGLVNNAKKKPIRVIEIQLKKSGTDLTDFSQYPHEREILVPFGTKFKVVSRKKGTPINGVKVTNIKMVEI